MRREQLKIDPNKVLGLAPGEAFVISRGKAMQVQVLKGSGRQAHRCPSHRASPAAEQTVSQRPTSGTSPRCPEVPYILF